MVYKKLELVIGLVLTYQDVMKIFNLTHLDELYSFEFQLPHEMQLYHFRCCSESNEKLFIIGYTKHTYYRKYIRCTDCPQYCVCSKCIGFTNNGHYDVQQILDGPTKVNIRNICLECFADNRIDMGARLETLPVVNHRFIRPTDEKYIENPKCTTCNSQIKLKSSFRSPKDQLCFDGGYNRLSKFAKKHCIDQEPQMYYMIDDCCSCT